MSTLTLSVYPYQCPSSLFLKAHGLLLQYHFSRTWWSCPGLGRSCPPSWWRIHTHLCWDGKVETQCGSSLYLFPVRERNFGPTVFGEGIWHKDWINTCVSQQTILYHPNNSIEATGFEGFHNRERNRKEEWETWDSLLYRAPSGRAGTTEGLEKGGSRIQVVNRLCTVNGNSSTSST